jgi:hypothetical protein
LKKFKNSKIHSKVDVESPVSLNIGADVKFKES